MHYSNDRILVTHVGSLPRSPALLDMLGQTEAGEEVDRGAFQAEVLDGLREAVREQAARASTSPATASCAHRILVLRQGPDDRVRRRRATRDRD